MKRFIVGAALAAALVVTSVGSAKAAEGLSVGVRAGYDYNIFAISGLVSDPGMGGGLGLSVKYAVVPDLINIVVEPTFNYRSIGGWADTSLAGYIPGGWDPDLGATISPMWVWSVNEFSITEMKITLPILVQYTYEDKYYGIGGIQIGIPVGTSINNSYQLVDDAGNKLGSAKDTSYSMGDSKYMKRAGVDVDVVVGAGFMFTPNFGIDVRYTYSFIEPINYELSYEFLGTKYTYSYPTSIMSVGLGLSYYF